MTSCSVCDEIAVSRCSKCREVFYCGRECQSKDWSMHKLTCGNERELSASPKLPAMEPTRVIPLAGEGYATWLKDSETEIPGLMVYVPVCGLNNVGNTCYLNAAVQALSCTPILQSVLQAVRHLDTHQSPSTCFLCAFEEVSRGLLTSTNPLTPHSLISMTKRKMFGDESPSHTAYGGQSDAQECLGFLIELLQDSIIDNAGLAPSEITKAERSSMIGHLFSFDVGQSVCCGSCKKENIQESSDLFLRLEITTGMSYQELAALDESSESSRAYDRQSPPAPPTSINELIQHYLRPEPLEGYKCEGCEKRDSSKKRARILRLPNVLLVMLDRNKSMGLWGKVDRHVYCPTSLTLGEFEYALYAMIVHLDYAGSTFFGHYVCFIHEGDGTWWLCDDEEVLEVTAEYVAEQQPFFVLYQILDPDIEPPPPGCDGRTFVYESVEEDVFLTPRGSNSDEESIVVSDDDDVTLRMAVKSMAESEASVRPRYSFLLDAQKEESSSSEFPNYCGASTDGLSVKDVRCNPPADSADEGTLRKLNVDDDAYFPVTPPIVSSVPATAHSDDDTRTVSPVTPPEDLLDTSAPSKEGALRRIMKYDGTSHLRGDSAPSEEHFGVEFSDEELASPHSVNSPVPLWRIVKDSMDDTRTAAIDALDSSKGGSWRRVKVSDVDSRIASFVTSPLESSDMRSSSALISAPKEEIGIEKSSSDNERTASSTVTSKGVAFELFAEDSFSEDESPETKLASTPTSASTRTSVRHYRCRSRHHGCRRRLARYPSASRREVGEKIKGSSASGECTAETEDDQSRSESAYSGKQQPLKEMWDANISDSDEKSGRNSRETEKMARSPLAKNWILESTRGPECIV